jgi:hypothetical protein
MVIAPVPVMVVVVIVVMEPLTENGEFARRSRQWRCSVETLRRKKIAAAIPEGSSRRLW